MILKFQKGFCNQLLFLVRTIVIVERVFLFLMVHKNTYCNLYLRVGKKAESNESEFKLHWLSTPHWVRSMIGSRMQIWCQQTCKDRLGKNAVLEYCEINSSDVLVYVLDVPPGRFPTIPFCNVWRLKPIEKLKSFWCSD